eukprot:COSAG01_NODE_70_length_28755_cov_34.709067_21_plen_73_part_00
MFSPCWARNSLLAQQAAAPRWARNSLLGPIPYWARLPARPSKGGGGTHGSKTTSCEYVASSVRSPSLATKIG